MSGTLPNVVLSILGGLAALGLSGCEAGPAPLRPASTEMLGLKSRVFPNTPEQVFDAARETLIAEGYVLREDEVDRGFLHGHTIRRDGADPEGLADHVWTRVTARVVARDKHKRAPRTLLELQIEELEGSGRGPIEASMTSFGAREYGAFFEAVEARLPYPRLPQLRMTGLE